MAKTTDTHAWLEQSLDTMEPGIRDGKTRRRKVETLQKLGITEADLKAAVDRRKWKVAQVGADYVFSPENYIIRPL